MRVLHLDSGREMRGGQWQVLRLIRGLRLAGCEVALRCRSGGPLFTRAQSENFDVKPLNVFHFPGCDLVHAHDARTHTLAAFRARVPLVVSRRVAFAPRTAWKYERASHFVAVSQFVANVLISGGVPERKITVVYDGVPLLPISVPGEQILIPESGDPQKGTELAVAAARATGLPFKLSHDLEADLATARMFVYITQSEGLGSGALLAMSAGVPVIASDVGGLPEAISHGENGLLTANTTEAISGAIRQLADNPERARLLAQRARQTVETRFSEEQMVQNTLEVYQGLLNA
ncbi:MAG: glycosyltransferase family 4 protein [Acidobacteriota bacterium]|nr:glycosyltransferase family 4 protein [Acidobacteriota bacterium]